MKSLFKEKPETEVSKMRRRKKRKASKPVFKPYYQDQITLLPPSIEELIPSNHIVRTVNRIIEEMDIEILLRSYKGGGSSAYNPRMLLKILLYAYIQQIYTSRKISKALREDIVFMWLSGNQRPNFRTINNFRSGRLKEVIEKIFASMIILLSEGKYINLENYFVDGTKIRANANKYSYVWAANTKRYKKGVVKKINGLLEQIDKLNEEEEKEYGEKDLEELGEESDLSSEKVKEEVKRLNEILKEINPKNNGKTKRITRAARKIEKEYLPKMIKYEEQEKKLNGRRSYSKTDEGATFFRMKDDQLLPCYNLLIGTEEQIITNYSIHQKASETDKFIAHIRKLEDLGVKYPKRVVGDSAYGSQENYNFLEDKSIESYLKYNTYHMETKGEKSKNKYHKDNFQYEDKEDKYICPEGKELNFIEEYRKYTENGYIQTIRIYKCQDGKGCSQLNQCSKSPQGRTIHINNKLDEYKKKARENLGSEKGIELSKKRAVDVETVFGDIKQNQGFRRLNLRGYEKVNAEIGLVCMAHNIKKISALIN